MTEVAGEVADGLICHAFTTERYLRQVTLPAVRRGRGGRLGAFEVVGHPMIATGRTEPELAAATTAVRAQIAFYVSTPAYRQSLRFTDGVISARSSTGFPGSPAGARWRR